MNQDFGVDSAKIASLMRVISEEKAKAVQAIEDFWTLVQEFPNGDFPAWSGTEYEKAKGEAQDLYNDAIKCKDIFDAYYDLLDTTKQGVEALATELC